MPRSSKSGQQQTQPMPNARAPVRQGEKYIDHFAQWLLDDDDEEAKLERLALAAKNVKDKQPFHGGGRWNAGGGGDGGGYTGGGGGGGASDPWGRWAGGGYRGYGNDGGRWSKGGKGKGSQSGGNGSVGSEKTSAHRRTEAVSSPISSIEFFDRAANSSKESDYTPTTGRSSLFNPIDLRPGFFDEDAASVDSSVATTPKKKDNSGSPGGGSPVRVLWSDISEVDDYDFGGAGDDEDQSMVAKEMDKQLGAPQQVGAQEGLQMQQVWADFPPDGCGIRRSCLSLDDQTDSTKDSPRSASQEGSTCGGRLESSKYQ